MFYGFAKILDYESYNEYVKLPYVSDRTSETVIPKYNPLSGTIEASSPIEQIRLE